MTKIMNFLAGASMAMIGIGALAIPAVSLAAYVAAGKTVALPATIATSTNAYLAGGAVDAATPVDGDLLIGGGNIVISSAVKNDIMAAGGTINIVNASANDVRVVGGNINIDGKFAGELMAAGGNITITPNSTIAKDSYVAAGTLTFMGNENGGLTVAGGNVDINGTVNGNLVVKRAGNVTIGPNAIIKGNFEYSAQQTATIDPSAKIAGQTTFHQMAASANNGMGSETTGIGIVAALLTFWLVAKFLIVLTAAYLLWYLARKDMTAIINDTRSRFWKKLFAGFAFLILVPVGAFILFLTLIGAIPALVAVLGYILLLILAAPVAIILASAILMALFKKSMTDLHWYHILIGAIVYTIIAFIPFLGWLADCIVYLLAIGGLMGILKTKFAN
jgi:cytoskeletal protein CcmA (bactofilin family)